MDTLTQHHRSFRYHAWANRETLASLREIAGAAPRAVKILAHVIAADELWLGRIEGAPPGPVWPDHTIDQCADRLERILERWGRFLGALPPDGLARRVEYVNSKGEPYSSTVHDILTHVVIHAAQHRGQVASAVRDAGGVPAYTDYIHCVRQGLVD